MRILVVEDDPGVRSTATRMLEFLGHTVVSTGGGDEAERLPENPPFDVVLTDLRLPGVRGPLLIERLRRRWPGLEAIIMSGDLDTDEVRAGALDGRWRLLPKPFNFDQLIAQLQGKDSPTNGSPLG
ncbi:MAG: response regulator [Acidobacteriia bacterium]|nr:response regulator [Terriglobia bacterium]